MYIIFIFISIFLITVTADRNNLQRQDDIWTVWSFSPYEGSDKLSPELARKVSLYLIMCFEATSDKLATNENNIFMRTSSINRNQKITASFRTEIIRELTRKAIYDPIKKIVETEKVNLFNQFASIITQQSQKELLSLYREKLYLLVLEKVWILKLKNINALWDSALSITENIYNQIVDITKWINSQIVVEQNDIDKYIQIIESLVKRYIENIKKNLINYIKKEENSLTYHIEEWSGKTPHQKVYNTKAIEEVLSSFSDQYSLTMCSCLIDLIATGGLNRDIPAAEKIEVVRNHQSLVAYFIGSHIKESIIKEGFRDYFIDFQIDKLQSAKKQWALIKADSNTSSIQNSSHTLNSNGSHSLSVLSQSQESRLPDQLKDIVNRLENISPQHARRLRKAYQKKAFTVTEFRWWLRNHEVSEEELHTTIEILLDLWLLTYDEERQEEISPIVVSPPPKVDNTRREVQSESHPYRLSLEMTGIIEWYLQDSSTIDAAKFIEIMKDLGLSFHNEKRFEEMFDDMSRIDASGSFLKNIWKHCLRPKDVPLIPIDITKTIKGKKLNLNKKDNRFLMVNKKIIMIGDHSLYDRYIAKLTKWEINV